VRSETLGIAYLQALENATTSPAARKRFARAARPLRRGRTAAQDRLSQAGARVLTRLKFAQATRFLRHIVLHAQTASLADLRKADLTRAGHAVVALEKEQARLHDALRRHLPPTFQAPRRSEVESHPDQLVHHLLEFIEQDYRKPITLQQCAGRLGMNASYLSDLFSRGVGVPFKAYLIERRLEKAKELLGDPAHTVSAVAYAVGYASEDRFRFAFRKATGLCPRLWRQTMQVNPPPPSPCPL
jgi:AraC-like DNA-binding protein